MMKFLSKIYPLFFAIFPVLFYYNTNRFETTISSLMFPFTLSIVIYACVYGILRLIVVDKNRLKLLLALFIFYFFSYVHFVNSFSFLKSLLSNLHLPTNLILFILYSSLIVLVGKLLLKIKDRDKLAKTLALIGIYLVIFPLTKIIPWEVSRAQTVRTTKDNTIDGVVIKNVARKPDIYYIILDRYANDTSLSDYYGFDNSDFLNFLKSKGFYIADHSYANFPKTHLSLASSLNLEYVNYFTKQFGKENKDYTPAFRMVQDNKVARILKSLGYRYIYFGDWWEPTRVNPFADENINLYSGSNEFLRKFFSTTVASPLIGSYLVKNDFLGFSDTRIYENMLYKFKKFDTVALKDSPKFVFAHMLLPHYPYVFDEFCLKSEDGTGPLEQSKYISQLKCTNTKMKVLVESILRKSKTPPVIIIQSDEGPFKIDEMNRSGEGVDWTKASDEAIKTHMRILNTYYIPDAEGVPIDYERKGFYRGITPVNSFRILFNEIFKTKFASLGDRSYFIPDLDKPYSYIDKTTEIKFK